MSTLITKPAWHVDGWSGNYVDDNGVDWFVHDDAGWFDGVDVRLFDSDKVNAGGSWSAPNLEASRVITLTGYAQAPTDAAADQARNQINALCRRGHLHQLLVEEPVTNKTAMVKRGGGKATPHTGRAFDFQLILIAPDPAKYGADVRTASTRLAQDAPGGIQWSGPAGATGLRWGGPAGTTGLEYQTGVGENGVIELPNDGTTDAPILFTISGPVTGPSIVRTDTGETIEWNSTVPSGSILEINTATGAVLLNGGNQRPLLSQSDFFVVPPGGIDVAFRSSSPSPTAELIAVWADAWY